MKFQLIIDEESEEVITARVKKANELTDKIENPDFISVKALPRIERTVEEGDYLTLFPHKNNCDGFFVAVFVRK